MVVSYYFWSENGKRRPSKSRVSQVKSSFLPQQVPTKGHKREDRWEFQTEDEEGPTGSNSK